jgi:membrane fusion protein (multidrug efflux system)
MPRASTDILHAMQERTSGKEQRAGAAPAQVRLRLSNGVEYAYAGKLQFSEVPALAGTGPVTARAVFPNAEGQLLAGMSVRLLVREGIRDQALLVPQRSVIRDTTGQASVAVVYSNNRVEVRPITTERMVAGQWLIGAGLNAGERIVVDRLQRVCPNISVTARTVSTPVESPLLGVLLRVALFAAADHRTPAGSEIDCVDRSQ